MKNKLIFKCDDKLMNDIIIDEGIFKVKSGTINRWYKLFSTKANTEVRDYYVRESLDIIIINEINKNKLDTIFTIFQRNEEEYPKYGKVLNIPLDILNKYLFLKINNEIFLKLCIEVITYYNKKEKN